jgi:hypothetical protein
MGYNSQRYKILEKAEVVDEETWHRHIDAFIKNFVVKEKRHRWHHLCLEKPEKAQHESSRMYSDLMWNLCSKSDYETEIDLASRKGKGVFYDFSGEAWWLTPADAFIVGHGYDSIFSFQEGTFAIYFWHELEDILCEK